jgi:transcriptional regulator with XRE-family HTH domain
MYTFITLKQLRELRGLTQHYVAAKVGVTQSAYSKIENFDCHSSIDNYKKIAEVLDADANQIIMNKIQALIHIKGNVTLVDSDTEKNIPMVADIINIIREHEYLLSRLVNQNANPAAAQAAI